MSYINPFPVRSRKFLLKYTHFPQTSVASQSQRKVIVHQWQPSKHNPTQPQKVPNAFAQLIGPQSQSAQKKNAPPKNIIRKFLISCILANQKRAVTFFNGGCVFPTQCVFFLPTRCATNSTYFRFVLAIHIFCSVFTSVSCTQNMACVHRMVWFPHAKVVL